MPEKQEKSLDGILRSIDKVTHGINPNRGPDDAYVPLAGECLTETHLTLDIRGNQVQYIFYGIILSDSIGHRIVIKKKANFEEAYDITLNRIYESFRR